MPRIVPFDKKYINNDFDCGVPALNNYLKTQASQDIRNYYSVIFVALEESLNKIMGFILCPTQVRLWNKYLTTFKKNCLNIQVFQLSA